MFWKLPPKIKIYEALGCIGDERIKIHNNNAKVYSSTGKKWYVVKYDPNKNKIMANDNASYWVGYLGYPSIAFLLAKGKIVYNVGYADVLKDIPWKEINAKFRNNYAKTEEYVKEIIRSRNCSVDKLEKEIESIYECLSKLKLEKLGKRIKPPKSG